MLFNSIINYKTNKKKIFFCNFICNKKYFFNLKIKKKINKKLLNIKQTIYLLFLFNFWKKIEFKNICLI
ncbi:hypothetical protein K5B08_01190, partial [Candidatus Carsonella ruddii]|nr:hypothetical protein [Candidatus Carsonella ruddii]